MSACLPQRRRRRLPDFDYRDAGAYFVTICSHNRALTFNDERVRGIVKGAWDETTVQFAHLRLDAFVVMPNYMHGAVFIASSGRGIASPLPVTPPLVSSAQPHVVGAMALPRPCR
ncbi:MAG: hypothetical protein Q7R39_10995 [Dehalococcoidia bacterium]|nr:hypothetical protein [Dehalococcoidia bacterium]